MKRVSAYVGQTELFIIANNDGMKINAGVSAKNELIKECVIKEIFGIQVIASVNTINLAILVNIQIIQIASVKQKLIDPLVEECTENINETKLVKKTLDEIKDRYSFSIVYKVLFWIFFIFFIISIEIGICFVYRKYVNCNKYDLPY